MKPIKNPIIILLGVFLISASPYPVERRYKNDGRLRVSCINLPLDVDPQNLEFNLFHNDVQVLSERNFFEREGRPFSQTEDSYWPAGMYDADIIGLFDVKVLVKDVEMRERVFTFLIFDHEQLDSMRMNSTLDKQLVVKWTLITPTVGKNKIRSNGKENLHNDD